MPIDLVMTALILFLAGLAAGIVNSIAGGGSLFTLPLLIFLGLPPTIANATNRIAVLSGGIGASETFRRSGLISVAWLKLAAPPALIGAVIGTGAALMVGDLAFQRILSVVLVLAAGWMLWNPIRPPEGSHFPPELDCPLCIFSCWCVWWLYTGRCGVYRTYDYICKWP